MFSLALIVALVALFNVQSVVGSSACSTANNCLSDMASHPTKATPFCSSYLATTNTARTGLPTYLPACSSNPASISSACSCLASAGTTAAASTSTITITVTTSVTPHPSTTTATITVTSTVTPKPSTSKTTITIKSTVTPKPSTTTTTSTTTVTVTTSVTPQPSNPVIDINGCPAIDGYVDGLGYVYQCGVTYGPGSIVQGTNPGYSIEDCSMQCFTNIAGGDCLGATFSGSSTDTVGQETPGTCTFYDYPNGRVLSPGTAAVTFQGF